MDSLTNSVQETDKIPLNIMCPDKISTWFKMLKG